MFFTFFVSPGMKAATHEERLGEIDAQASRGVAANQAFISSLNLPPSFSSRPPAERSSLLTELARAAGNGDEAAYRKSMKQIDPSASELTISASYGIARREYLHQRESALITQYVQSSGSASEREYWLKQLSANSKAIWDMESSSSGFNSAEDRSADLLRRIEASMRSQGIGRRAIEELFESSLSGGFSIPSALSAAKSSPVAALPSEIDSDKSVSGHLAAYAITRMREAYEECRLRYRDPFQNDSAESEFNIRFSRLRALCGSLLPAGFEEQRFGDPILQQEDSLRTVDSAIRAAAAP